MLTCGTNTLSRIRVCSSFLLPPLAARDDMDAGQMHFSAKVEQIQRASDCRNGRRQFDGESGG